MFLAFPSLYFWDFVSSLYYHYSELFCVVCLTFTHLFGLVGFYCSSFICLIFICIFILSSCFWGLISSDYKIIIPLLLLQIIFTNWVEICSVAWVGFIGRDLCICVLLGTVEIFPSLMGRAMLGVWGCMWAICLLIIVFVVLLACYLILASIAGYS